MFGAAAGIAGTTTVGRARAGIGAAMHGVKDMAGAADMAGIGWRGGHRGYGGGGHRGYVRRRTAARWRWR